LFGVSSLKNGFILKLTKISFNFIEQIIQKFDYLRIIFNLTAFIERVHPPLCFQYATITLLDVSHT